MLNFNSKFPLSIKQFNKRKKVRQNLYSKIRLLQQKRPFFPNPWRSENALWYYPKMLWAPKIPFLILTAIRFPLNRRTWRHPIYFPLTWHPGPLLNDLCDPRGEPGYFRQPVPGPDFAVQVQVPQLQRG